MPSSPQSCWSIALAVVVIDRGRITKMGDKYLRKLLIVGMTSLVRRAKYNPGRIDPRLADLLARKATCRHRRDGEQDRAGHLGDHGTRRDLSCRPPAGIGRMKGDTPLS